MQGTVFHKDDFYPLKQISYEGIMLDFPNNVEKGLNRVYGDFMKLPPEEKRRNHCPEELVFLNWKAGFNACFLFFKKLFNVLFFVLYIL